MTGGNVEPALLRSVLDYERFVAPRGELQIRHLRYASVGYKI